MTGRASHLSQVQGLHIVSVRTHVTYTISFFTKLNRASTGSNVPATCSMALTCRPGSLADQSSPRSGYTCRRAFSQRSFIQDKIPTRVWDQTGHELDRELSENFFTKELVLGRCVRIGCNVTKPNCARSNSSVAATCLKPVSEQHSQIKVHRGTDTLAAELHSSASAKRRG